MECELVLYVDDEIKENDRLRSLGMDYGMWSYLHRTFLAHLVLFQFYLQYPNILQFSHYNSLFYCYAIALSFLLSADMQ